MAVSAAPRQADEAQHAWLRFLAAAWSWLFLLALVVFFESWARAAYGISFLFNGFNVQSIAMFAAAPLLLGLGQTFVIISGGIDLSVGFVMGLCAVIMARVMQSMAGLPPEVALLSGLLAAFLIALIPGTINGFLIARLRVPAFIGTLGMFGVARGTGFLAAGGTTVPVNNPWLFQMGSAKLLGVPLPVLITIVVVLAPALRALADPLWPVHLRDRRQPHGGAALGHQRPPSHDGDLSDLGRLRGIAGMIYTARFSAGAAQAGEPMLLDSIAAVVIGGASLFGGSGTIIGTVIGALIIAVIQYGLVFIDVEPFWQFVAVGVVIIVSVLVDQSQSRLRGEIQDDA